MKRVWEKHTRAHTHTHSFCCSLFSLKTMIPWRLLVFFPCQCLSNSKVVDIFLLPWPSLAVSMLFSNREWHINDSLYRVRCATLRRPQPPYGQRTPRINPCFTTTAKPPASPRWSAHEGGGGGGESSVWHAWQKPKPVSVLILMGSTDP